MKYAVSGLFLTKMLTGMERYGIEVLSCLDNICGKDEIEIILPVGVNVPYTYMNIPIRHYGKLKGIAWEQICFPNYLRKSKEEGMYFRSIVPFLGQKGMVMAYGINYKVNPQFFKSFRDKLSRLYHVASYGQYLRHMKKIVTISEFSKSEIMRVYNVPEERLTIAPCAWQHILRIEEAKDIFDRYDFLEPDNFYFSLSSVNENKNFIWIVKVAINNPNCTFAIAGGRSFEDYLKRCGIAKPDNLHFLGFVSDNDVKALMHNCKAFLFPTFYEGFGMTPLEAMACGCSVIVSDTPTMHEVYENSAHYIDPHDYNVDLDAIMTEPTEPAEKILNKYSWEESARIIYSLMKQ